MATEWTIDWSAKWIPFERIGWLYKWSRQDMNLLVHMFIWNRWWKKTEHTLFVVDFFLSASDKITKLYWLTFFSWTCVNYWNFQGLSYSVEIAFILCQKVWLIKTLVPCSWHNDKLIQNTNRFWSNLKYFSSSKEINWSLTITLSEEKTEQS